MCNYELNLTLRQVVVTIETAITIESYLVATIENLPNTKRL